MRSENMAIVILIVIFAIWFGIYIEKDLLFAIATTLAWIGFATFMLVILD